MVILLNQLKQSVPESTKRTNNLFFHFLHYHAYMRFLLATCLFDEHHAKPLWELPGSTLGSEARKLTLSRRGSWWRSYIITRPKFNKVAPARFIRWLVDMMVINLSIICQLCVHTNWVYFIPIIIGNNDLSGKVCWSWNISCMILLSQVEQYEGNMCLQISCGEHFWLFDEIFCCVLPCPGHIGQHLGVLGASIA